MDYLIVFTENNAELVPITGRYVFGEEQQRTERRILG